MSDYHYRYRRIIDAYREALRLRAPLMCQTVDAQMVAWGEGWVCDDEVPDVDALMTAAAIARKFGFQRWDIANWVRQGKIKAHPHSGTGSLYRVGDVLVYFAQKNGK